MRISSIVLASVLCGACAAGDTEPKNIKVYAGDYSVQVIESTVTQSLQGGGTFPCTNTYRMTGTLTLKVDQSTGAPESVGIISGAQTEIAHSSGDSCKAKGDLSTSWAPKLVVSANDLHFDAQNVVVNGGYTVTSKTTFAGTLSNGVVTGVLGFSVSGAGIIEVFSNVTQNYSTSVSVTLR
jgi:hypothetical protein